MQQQVSSHEILFDSKEYQMKLIQDCSTSPVKTPQKCPIINKEILNTQFPQNEFSPEKNPIDSQYPFQKRDISVQQKLVQDENNNGFKLLFMINDGMNETIFSSQFQFQTPATKYNTPQKLSPQFDHDNQQTMDISCDSTTIQTSTNISNDLNSLKEQLGKIQQCENTTQNSIANFTDKEKLDALQPQKLFQQKQLYQTPQQQQSSPKRKQKKKQTVSKKNHVKNLIKAFSRYLTKWGNKFDIMRVCEIDNEHALFNFQKSFMKFEKKKKYNNKMMYSLINSKQYSKIFFHFIYSEAEEWLQHSNVQDKDNFKKLLVQYQEEISQKILKNDFQDSDTLSPEDPNSFLESYHEEQQSEDDIEFLSYTYVSKENGEKNQKISEEMGNNKPVSSIGPKKLFHN